MSSQRKSKKNVVLKHSSAIQSERKMSLLQAKCYNVFIANSFDNMKQEEQTISVTFLMDYLGYSDYKNQKRLKKLLEEMVWQKVKFNLLGKDGKKIWGVTTPLSFCRIAGDVCEYGFSKPLREVYSDPRLFSKIKLGIQNRFTSKYALFLYELFFDYLGIRQTPEIPLEKFRELVGLEKHEYKAFNDLNKRILKPALNEINKYTDIFVEVEKIKIGRKISFLKFFISKNKNYNREMVRIRNKRQMNIYDLVKENKQKNQLALVKNIEIQPINQQIPIPEPLEIQTTPQLLKEEIKPQIEQQQPIINEKDSQTVQILTSFNFPEEEIKTLIKTYGKDKINTISRLLKEGKNTIKNPRGWFYSGITKGYDDWQLKQADEKKRKIAEQKRKEAEKRAKEEKAKREREEKLLKWKQENKDKYEAVLIECFGDLLSDKRKEIVLNAIKKKAQKDKVELFESAKNHPYLKAVANTKIEEKYLNKKLKVETKEEKRQEQKEKPYRNQTNKGLESLGGILKRKSV